MDSIGIDIVGKSKSMVYSSVSLMFRAITLLTFSISSVIMKARTCMKGVSRFG